MRDFKRARAFFSRYNFELILPILALGIFLSIASPYFLKLHNFYNIGNQIAINVIIALGMTLVVSSGGMDLSVGSIVALTGVAVGVLYERGLPTTPAAAVAALLVGLSVGTAVGLVNGLIISTFHVQPFICTLGSEFAVRGLALVLTGGRTIMGMPDNFLGIFSGFVLGVPKPVIAAIAFSIVVAVLFSRTTLGRIIQSIGGNQRCVRVCGINVERYQVAIYCLSGALAGAAGLVLATTMATADPLAGNWYELDAVAVVVMGGTSLDGGRGSIRGTLLGALFLGLVRNGLNIMNIHANYQTLFVGLLIMFSIILSGTATKRQKACD